jgi:hypothetical protein
MSEIKILKFNENNTFTDSNNITRPMPKNSNPFRGHVVLRDENGDIILEKDNMIVLRGRTFALEKLFDSTASGSGFPTGASAYIENLNRKICLFKIGKGGAPISSPFSPDAVSYEDTDLVEPIPFVIHDPTGTELDPDNNSIIEDLPTRIANKPHKYQLGVNSTIISTTGSKDYYAKTFDADPEWYYNLTDNEVYKKITCSIGLIDARNEIVNELGLFFGSYDNVTGIISNVEMFSRITFDTESLSNPTKQIIVEYYVYA